MKFVDLPIATGMAAVLLFASNAQALSTRARGMGEAGPGHVEGPGPGSELAGPGSGSYRFSGPHFDLSMTRRRDSTARMDDPPPGDSGRNPSQSSEGFFGRAWNGFFGLFGGGK